MLPTYREMGWNFRFVRWARVCEMAGGFGAMYKSFPLIPLDGFSELVGFGRRVAYTNAQVFKRHTRGRAGREGEREKGRGSTRLLAGLSRRGATGMAAFHTHAATRKTDVGLADPPLPSSAHFFFSLFCINLIRIWCRRFPRSAYLTLPKLRLSEGGLFGLPCVLLKPPPRRVPTELYRNRNRERSIGGPYGTVTGTRKPVTVNRKYGYGGDHLFGPNLPGPTCSRHPAFKAFRVGPVPTPRLVHHTHAPWRYLVKWSPPSRAPSLGNGLLRPSLMRESDTRGNVEFSQENRNKAFGAPLPVHVCTFRQRGQQDSSKFIEALMFDRRSSHPPRLFGSPHRSGRAISESSTNGAMHRALNEKHARNSQVQVQLSSSPRVLAPNGPAYAHSAGRETLQFGMPLVSISAASASASAVLVAPAKSSRFKPDNGLRNNGENVSDSAQA
ncbi:hypothetical protein FB451DRAFT_1184310 [Mycena latifolia]|nr:hypothetical protein FB451DRAFT_1184310 [Mycena latifolia]